MLLEHRPDPVALAVLWTLTFLAVGFLFAMLQRR